MKQSTKLKLTALCLTLALVSSAWLKAKVSDRLTVHQSAPCNCNGSVTIGSAGDERVHWCSRQASQRAFHQKIVAFSLFGDAINEQLRDAYPNLRPLSFHPDVFKRYFTNLINIARQVKSFYPGWTIRIYHNFNENQTEVHQTLCQVYCLNDHVDLCHVRDVAESLNRFESAGHPSPIPADLGRLNRMIWRYLPLMDPLVDVFMSRDSDSDVNQREAAAVGQWLQSNSTFHVIRDHQYHKEAILGGLFGVKVHQRRDLIQGLMRVLATMATKDEYGEDQKLLADIFWPVVKDDAVIHDSYSCQKDWNSVPVMPFPTQRRNLTYVADREDGQFPRPKECPPACRPADHQDWNFC